MHQSFDEYLKPDPPPDWFLDMFKSQFKRDGFVILPSRIAEADLPAFDIGNLDYQHLRIKLLDNVSRLMNRDAAAMREFFAAKK